MREEGTTFKVTVLVWIVTPEEYTLLVSVDDHVVGADGLEGGPVAEILPVDGALVAPAQDVSFGVVGQGDGLVQADLDLVALGGIAAGMDGILGDCAGVPYGGSCGIGASGHMGWCRHGSHCAG